MKTIIKVPEDFNDYEIGQLFRVKSPLGKDIAVLTLASEEPKYPFSDNNGQKSRSLGLQDDNKVKFITPEEEGGNPDDTQIRYDLQGKMGNGSYSFVEGDTRIAEWEFEPIYEGDPDFDEELHNYGTQIGNMFDKMAKMFSEEPDDDEDFSSIFKDF